MQIGVKKLFPILFQVFFLTSITFCLQAQHRPVKNKIDSVLPAKVPDTVSLKLQTDTLLPDIVNKIDRYSFLLNRSSSFSRYRIVDTTTISNGLPLIETHLGKLRKRVQNGELSLNMSNLNTIMLLVQTSSEKLTEWQESLNTYSDKLIKNNADIKKILRDSSLRNPVSDTALETKIAAMLTKSVSLDSSQQIIIYNISQLRNKVSLNSLMVNDLLADLEYRKTTLRTSIWHKEEPSLFAAKPSDYNQSTVKTFSDSIINSFKVLLAYINMTWGTRILNLFILTCLIAWCSINLVRIKKYKNASKTLEPIHFLNRSVLLSCVVLVLTIGPLFYNNPPQIYLYANEFLRLSALSFLLLPILSPKSKSFWFPVMIMWLYYTMDDIMMESTFIERWLLLIAGISTAIIAVVLLKDKKPFFKNIVESKGARLVLIVTLLGALLSIVFNIWGRTTLSKILGITAIQSLVVAISLKVFCTILLEAVFLQTEAIKSSRLSAFFNYEVLQKKLVRILWVVAIFIWVAVLLRNLTIYDITTTIIGRFFDKTRSIGNISFSFKSVAIFIFVIWIASQLSQFITFFFGHDNINTNKRSRSGSVGLLIRIALWAIGFLIAVAAAGIPLEKVSVMIGALGVGIGFGLQNIVNNLVSGIILAFERPIQIGDQVEIGTRSGTVKEIGVRSSKITNYSGADIIIPNGDLLSQHIVNWTLSNRNKRMEVVIGIGYNSDIEAARKIIMEILGRNNVVMKTPPPAVFFNTFGQSSLELRILFWVADLANGEPTRTAVMIEIFNEFNKANIEIPFPKQDIYIKQVPTEKEEK